MQLLKKQTQNNKAMRFNRNYDLSKVDLNKVLRNPTLILSIQDKLMALKGDGFFTAAIRAGAKRNIKDCIRTIIDAYKDNPDAIKKIIDKETLEMIEEHEGITLADDIKDVL